ncbi:MAG: bifunctional non-homologous end joining protein LigD, partial [Chloroflexi bacterium]
MPEPEATYVEVEGRTVRLTHLDKVLFPDDGITKAEILQYYVTVAPYLLPHIRGRPLTLKAFPHGINGRPYYRRKLAATAPAWLPRAPFEDGFSPYIENLPDLMWVANQDSVELHPWLSRQENLLHPDLLLFDLDPGRGVPFSRICEGAVIVRDALAQIDIQSWAKTSGGAGMHILFGINPDYDFQQTHDWVRAVATVLAQSQPTLFTVNYSKEKRVGKLLLDYN